MGKIRTSTYGWKRQEGRKLTPEEKEKLAEAERQYCLEVEKQRRERSAALSRMPRDRLLD